MTWFRNYAWNLKIWLNVEQIQTIFWKEDCNKQCWQIYNIDMDNDDRYLNDSEDGNGNKFQNILSFAQQSSYIIIYSDYPANNLSVNIS